jgi:hypothetical protein
MYDWLNRSQWEKCFSLTDPQLRGQSKIVSRDYADGLQAFKDAYGSVNPWYVRISLHLDASANRHDKRPFAYVYVVWQDAEHSFHMFRERWVKDSDRWYTRVAGLVPNRREPAPGRD